MKVEMNLHQKVQAQISTIIKDTYEMHCAVSRRLAGVVWWMGGWILNETKTTN